MGKKFSRLKGISLSELNSLGFVFLFTKCFQISSFELSVAEELQTLFMPEDHFRCFACARIIQCLGKQNLDMEIICSK